MLWYEVEIQLLEDQRASFNYEPDTLFYGSSSIRQWTTLADDFKGLKPVNLGFGGSTLAACAWFFDRITDGFQPERIVVYAGDNDLADGRHPQEVAISFKYLADCVMARYGPIPCYFISLKPSIARWGLIAQFKYANELLADAIKGSHQNWHWVDIFTPMLNVKGQPEVSYFNADGLHLNDEGYRLWSSVLLDTLNPK
ncbi:GDSL family lipase [Mucilaginibacter sp. 21P]|nr:GDSL family lipase [Mucilaginibacter sp. 21P]